MADPLTAALMIGGKAMSFAGQMNAARDSQIAANWNADVADRNARVLETQAGQSLLQGGRDVAAFRSKFGRFSKEVDLKLLASGFDPNSGSAILIKMANAEQADKDIAMIELNAEREASDLRQQAVNDRLQGSITRFEGKAAANAMRTQAYASLLKGGSDTARYIR